jgi:hypothetical protein
MSTKTITMTICDKCGKEIKGRLITHRCPCCYADICVQCQETEDAIQKEIPSLPAKKRGRPPKGLPAMPIDLANKENLTIHTPTGAGDDTEYKVNILGSEATGPSLWLTVLAALEEWGGKVPDNLTDEEKNLIDGILEPGN